MNVVHKIHTSGPERTTIPASVNRLEVPPVKFLKLIASLALGACLVPHAVAQNYPSKPVTLVVPYLPGGATDVLARLLAAQMEKTIGQSIVVENKPGADARIGAKAVAESAPDGHTLLLGSGSIASWDIFFKEPGIGPKQLAPITQLTNGDILLATHSGAPFKTLKEAIAYGKANPGKLNWATPGAGEPTLFMGLLEEQAGIKMTEVRFKGSDQVTALLRGDVHFAMPSPGRAVAPVKEGRWVLLATTGDRRDTTFPDVPTFAELGFTGFDSYWFGLLGRAGMQREQIIKVREAALVALKEPKVREAVQNYGWRIVGSTPDELAALIQRHNAKWKKAAASIGLKPE
jgi:tripartite-type tricarboxylate transporter receptor subunit TctC